MTTTRRNPPLRPLEKGDEQALLTPLYHTDLYGKTMSAPLRAFTSSDPLEHDPGPLAKP
jgi:hypothetical protein